jgi:hypothetical protein
MADAAAVAAISGGLAVLGSALGSGVVYKTSQRQTQVQLRSIEAEAERLRAGYAEEGRRQREVAYRELIGLLMRLDLMMMDTSDQPLHQQAYDDWSKSYYPASGAVFMFGAVRDAQGDLGAVMTAIDLKGYDDDGHYSFEKYAAAFREDIDKYRTAMWALIEAMRLDVAPGTATHPGVVPPGP